jgi:hypothetical protein
MSLGLVFSALILLSPCGQEAPEARLGEELSLKSGQTGRVRGEKLLIRFLSVTQDSRCPKGEQCITAGNGQIALELSTDAFEPKSFFLNTSAEPGEVAYGGYGVRLVSLTPYPITGRTFEPAEYVAILIVHKL